MKTQYTFKVVFYGNARVGKTSIVNRYTTNEFHAHVQHPVSLWDSKTVELTSKDKKQYSVVLNMFHQPQEDIMTSSPDFIGQADAIISVFSVDDHKSFEDASGWLYFGEQHSNASIKFLLANKTDKKERAVSRMEAMELAKQCTLNYMEVSARSGKNVTDFFVTLAKLLLKAKVTKPIEKPKSPENLQQIHGTIYQRLDQDEAGLLPNSVLITE
ncbi:hypothetical protein EIN_227760 [Entamoeba invadens IP1]|uniref:Uncharacterized protein n=1 Tax=Entamoeba invadens IP1 TaxID=370355 RepID=A0A0A1U8P1_ENTIV|nr:hypothetical protein EIN_227760 [Entamoeba invadens IP1]ELP88353.1 hypothetical protein EIN_227760 [Entamoeba invadens IP1]|eukprot:XP_004255124.1 hypothetical protein EIN_227760 [Entamoeba invadens IP1]